MRKKYKDLQQKVKNKINDDRKDLNTIQIIQNQNDNEELDNLNNLKKRNTISHFPAVVNTLPFFSGKMTEAENLWKTIDKR